MNGKKNFKTAMALFALVIVVFSMRISTSFASTFTAYLAAREFEQTMPGGEIVTMYGFVQDSNRNLENYCGEIPTAPGPLINIPSTKDVLRIKLRNDLGVPVSLMIPGLEQTSGKDPHRDDLDSTGRMRVTSFREETQPHTIGTYEWKTRPGTFMLRSGSNPAVQVQMGLYAGVKQDYRSTRQAYKEVTTRHIAEQMIFFSEIDPDLHKAVADGSYGTPAYPSTIHYKPKYFLINGGNASSLVVGRRRETVLLRLFNTGLQPRVPTLLGPNWEVIAEDGYAYNYSKNDQYSTLLTAMKTKDILLKIPSSARTGDRYPLFDRKLGLMNNVNVDLMDINDPESGMLTYLEVGARPRSGSGLWPWGAPKTSGSYDTDQNCVRVID
ncbi:hypothetical protein AU255_00250 [Methyloprofundus sedimenti]|uniref:Plastocyanin-like domain-containing protein n=1 Tax=Methyloprofundus sedimenti TaxID=1420851 RepID=A0A1V8M4A1_9GAMM|nr:hypothetical protein [Methyloprofundus sedimenti]OQK16382.1 hypothetical protein AU255_00250 [Methyloprofundus sedimenti]